MSNAKPSRGWSWFEREAASETETRAAGGDLPDPGRALRMAYARCFSSAEGEQVLKHLRAITLERAMGPGVPSDTLRHIEGQRQLVSYIAALTARGRQGE